MPGIRHLKKDPATMNYILNELLKPGIREKLFDDIYGLVELGYALHDPRTALYGIFEKGRPEPIGVVFFMGVIAYRNCTLYAVMFDEANRRQGKLFSVCQAIKTDLARRYAVHGVMANVIGDNEASHHLLPKLGFTKQGPALPEGIFAGGKYQDLHTYYLMLGGEGQKEV